MAKRLHSTYRDYLNNYDYDVEIHDINFSGASTEIAISTNGGSGILKKFEGEELELFQFIVPTTLEIEFIISIQAHLDFYDDLKEADEKQFFVKIYKGAAIDFIGMLSIDDTYMDATPIEGKRLFKVTARDGLSYLKNVQYEAAQVQDYIDQQQLGKFRIKPDSSQVYLSATGDRSPWKQDVHNFTSGFDFITGAFDKVGRYDFKAYVSIIGDASAYINANGITPAFVLAMTSQGFLLQLSLYKIDIHGSTVQLADPQDLRFIVGDNTSNAISSKRVTASIEAESVEVLDGETVFCKLTWSYNNSYIEYTVEESSYFENVIDAPVSIDNVYASFKDHIGNIFSQLPTINEYPSGTDVIVVNVPEAETNQGAAKGEDYNGIPYNGFITDYTSNPPTAISCYDALKEIAIQCAGSVEYRNGKYYILPYNDRTTGNAYDKDMNFRQAVTNTLDVYDDNSTIPECIGKGQYTYVQAARHLELCYDRLTTANVLAGAAAQFPTDTYGQLYTIKNANLPDREHRLKIVIRIGTVIKPAALITLANSGAKFLHAFLGVLKLGSDYLKIENLNEAKQAVAIYSLPEYSADSSNKIDIHGPLQSDGIKEHIIEVSFDLPALAYTGDVEVGMEYDRTYVNVSQTEYTETVLTALQWSIDSIQLTTLDRAEDDKYYTDSVCTKVYSENNSETYSFKTRFSDNTIIENDGGALRVYDGSEWVQPNSYGGRSRQMAITQLLANRVAKPMEIINHEYRVSDQFLGHTTPDGTTVYMMVSGTWNSVYNRIAGQWCEYRISAFYERMNSITYIKNAGAESDNSKTLNGASNNGGGTTATVSTVTEETGGGTLERYYYYTDTFAGSTITLPTTGYRLPDPSIYTTTEMIAMFIGSLRASGNYVYNATPTRPEHFSIDFVNLQINLGREIEAGTPIFFTWFIL